MQTDASRFTTEQVVMCLSLAAAVAIAGCSSLAPSYERPALPVPERYPGIDPTQVPAHAALMAWQDYCTDAKLRALVELAMANNRDLRAAVLRVEEARAAYGIQTADRLPTIAAALDAARARVPGDLNITG
jgi:multidrug efflux system outer membrane protein